MTWQKELAAMATELEKTAVSRALTVAERKKAERERKRASGLVRVDVWIKTEKRAELERIVQELNR